MFQKTNVEDGQSLIEVIVVLGLTAVVAVGLVIVVLTSLKNAKFAQNQAKATKFAQEAMEQIKSIRDRDLKGSINLASTGWDDSSPFSVLWQYPLSNNAQSPCINRPEGVTGGCYFKLDNGNTLAEPTLPGLSNSLQDMEDGLSRQIIITDDASYQQEKTVAVKVFWKDAGGEHESNLQTKLTKY